MADQALAALPSAATDAELEVAILRAMPFNDHAHPDVMDAIAAAQERQRRLRRVAMLTADATAAVPVARQDSHRQRMGYLVQAQTNRSMGLDDAILKRAMKDTCRDFRCPDCTESGSYKSVCLNFMLSCLAIRIQTRIHYDKVNKYNIPPETTALLQEFVNGPIQFWLNEHAYFRKIPDMLDRIYTRIVQPTAVDKATRGEADDYKRHTDSIRKIVESILKCEAAIANPPQL
jgi:hypothetical protein